MYLHGIQIVQPFRCLRLAMIVCKAKNVGHITNVSQLVLLPGHSPQEEGLKVWVLMVAFHTHCLLLARVICFFVIGMCHIPTSTTHTHTCLQHTQPLANTHTHTHTHTQVVKSITIKLGGVLFIVLVFIVLYSCIGVHLVMEPFIEISEVNIR